MADVNDFVRRFVLHRPQHQDLLRAHHEVFDKVAFHECPVQKNGIDCGLFCVGIVLHLLHGKTVTKKVFSHKDVSNLRLQLTAYFTGGNEQGTHQPTSQVV